MPDSSFDHDATALVMGIFWSVGDVCIFLLIMRSEKFRRGSIQLVKP